MAGKIFEVILAGKTDLGEVMEKAAAEVEAAMDRIKEEFASVERDTAELGASSSASLDEMGGAGLLAGGKLGKGLEEAEGHTRSFKSAVLDMAKYAGLGVAGAGAAIAGFSVEAADKFENAQASLKASVTASGESWDKYQSQINAAENGYTKFGLTSTQVAEALSGSVVSTQSVTKSLSLLNVATDLSVVKHVDLASAMNVVNRAMTGNMRALKQLGIDINVPTANAHALWKAQQTLSDAQLKAKDVAIQYGSQIQAGGKDWNTYQQALLAVKNAHINLMQIEGAHTQILKVLSERLGGQASAAAGTFQGKMKALHAEIENVAIKIGLKLIPILEILVSVISKVFLFIVDHKPVLIALGVLAGTVMVISFAAWTKELYGTAQGLLGLGSSAGEAAAPLTALGAEVDATATAVTAGAEEMAAAVDTAAVEIDTGIGSTGIGAILIGLGIAITLLATHWKLVWGWIKDAFDAVVNFVKDHSRIIILALAPIALPVIALIAVIKELGEHWKTIWGWIKDAVRDAWDVIHPIWNVIVTVIRDEIIVWITVLKSIWQAFWTVAGSLVSAAWSVIQGIWSLIVQGVQVVVSWVHTIWNLWTAAWRDISDALSTAYNDVVKPTLGAIASAIGAVTSALGPLKSAWDAVFGGGGSVASTNPAGAAYLKAHPGFNPADVGSNQAAIKAWEQAHGFGSNGQPVKGGPKGHAATAPFTVSSPNDFLSGQLADAIRQGFATLPAHHVTITQPGAVAGTASNGDLIAAVREGVLEGKLAGHAARPHPQGATVEQHFQITVHATSADPQEVVRAIHDYARTNGKYALQALTS